jgi:hypothetical protein
MEYRSHINKYISTGIDGIAQAVLGLVRKKACLFKKDFGCGFCVATIC